MLKIGDYNTIVNDRNIFNQIVYTPLSEALNLLDERMRDKTIAERIATFLNNDIPDVLLGGRSGVMGRQIATPNLDTQRFVKLTRENALRTILFEYPDDKFTSNNSFKHSLGQIRIHHGTDKNSAYVTEKRNIIDMVKHDGKKLRDIVTLWQEPLVDFHRKLFAAYGLAHDLVFYDMSAWYKENGGSAAKYYRNYLLLFVTHGILFENFLTRGTEREFSKNVVLPAIEQIMHDTGLKPLIVPLSIMDIEEEEYWISHPPAVAKIIPKERAL